MINSSSFNTSCQHKLNCFLTLTGIKPCQLLIIELAWQNASKSAAQSTDTYRKQARVCGFRVGSTRLLLYSASCSEPRFVHASILSSTWLGKIKTAHSFNYKLSYFWNAAADETQHLHWSASAASTGVGYSAWERCGSAMPGSKQLYSSSAHATAFCCGWIWPQGGTSFSKMHVGLRSTGETTTGAYFVCVCWGGIWLGKSGSWWVTGGAWRRRAFRACLVAWGFTQVCKHLIA